MPKSVPQHAPKRIPNDVMNFVQLRNKENILRRVENGSSNAAKLAGVIKRGGIIDDVCA